MPEADYL